MAATAGAAVTWIGNLAVEEAQFLCDVKGKVKELEDELRWMTCFLKDTDANRDRDARLREWIIEIVWMAYEAEDIIESFIIKVKGNRRSGLMNKLERHACFIKELTLFVHKVGSDIDELTLRISKLTCRLQTCGIKPTREYDSSSVRREVLLRKSYAHYVEDENNIVGMDKEVQKVVEQLLKKNVDGESRVVALCGMGGLGKTTLAKKVYYQSDVRHGFEAFAWACISQQCQIKSVLIELVRGLTSEKADTSWEPDKLMETVHKVQRDKKCLVVFDDIWTNEDWDALKAAFPNDLKSGGKLILTTRIQSTAQHVDLNAFIYNQRELTDTEAWELLKRKLGNIDPSNTFGEEHVVEMKTLAEEMLKRCGGLPLAIVALGGILATKKSLDEWRTTHANIKSLLPNVKGGGQSCKEVLVLSYYDLPMYLKPCFLYLGLFEEDAEIPARKLIHLWVAEGFISASFNEGSLEEVGEAYLAELVDRSLVQVVKTRKNGSIKTCRIHDLVRDVCLSEAAKENFLKVVVVDGSQQHYSTRRRCRRLAIHDEGGAHWPKILADYASNDKFNAQHIKSLFLKPLEDSLTLKVVKQFKLLRVLDLVGVEARALPKEVGDLVHLRYLSIRDSKISILPSSIENLRNLRTLDLRVFEAKFPFVIWIRMRQLRHLYLPERWKVEGSRKDKCMVNRKDRLKNTSLETIKNLDPSLTKYVAQCSNLRKLWFLSFPDMSMKKEELEHMTNPQSLLRGCLESLRLRVTSEVATGLAAAFDNFVHLKSMQLNIVKYTRDGNSTLKSGMLHGSITTLRIYGARIENTDAMQILGRLPNLRELILDYDSYIGKHMTCSQQGPFRKLTFLYLRTLRKLEEWTIEEGAMTSLETLKIEFLGNLKMIPDGIKSIRSLQVLNLDGMPEPFTDRVSKKSETNGLAKQVRGVDFHKVQHIPKFRIDGRQVVFE